MHIRSSFGFGVAVTLPELAELLWHSLLRLSCTNSASQSDSRSITSLESIRRQHMASLLRNIVLQALLLTTLCVVLAQQEPDAALATAPTGASIAADGVEPIPSLPLLKGPGAGGIVAAQGLVSGDGWVRGPTKVVEMLAGKYDSHFAKCTVSGQIATACASTTGSYPVVSNAYPGHDYDIPRPNYCTCNYYNAGATVQSSLTLFCYAFCQKP